MKKINLIPALITLLAGAITSVSLYLLGYDYITMLLILLAVLIVFYVIGVMVMRYFRGIYLRNKEIEDAKRLEELMAKKKKKNKMVVTEEGGEESEENADEESADGQVENSSEENKQ